LVNEKWVRVICGLHHAFKKEGVYSPSFFLLPLAAEVQHDGELHWTHLTSDTLEMTKHWGSRSLSLARVKPLSHHTSLYFYLRDK
jgi:hypothetical protein